MLQTMPLLFPVRTLRLSSLSSVALLECLLATLHQAGSRREYMYEVHRLADWAAGVQVLNKMVLQA